ncbi:MAG: FG-GAP-like repeat-containing protein [Thermoguttaceae bacterium]|jgi:glyoxylase-like metal-dependent hydrolase (beta-lactamase superfamily II)
MLVASAPAEQSKAPAWDVRGVGMLPWQGVTCLNVGSDGRVAVGTIAPSGDPNVLLLDSTGRLVGSWAVGQRWIQDAVLAGDGRKVFATCTMPEGRASDAPTAFLCAEKVEKVGVALGEYDYPWTAFHYGDHSNHSGTVLRPFSGGAVGVWRNQVCWLKVDRSAAAASAAVQLPENAVTVSLAVAPNGEAVLGCAAPLGTAGQPQANLFLLAPGEKQPRWTRTAKPRTAELQKPGPGIYGTPRGNDGAKHEVPQEDVEIRAPLSLTVDADATGAVRRVATADYAGWQRWMHDPADIGRRSSTRFLPTRPAVSVYDRNGKLVREFAPDLFDRPLWVDLQFLPGGQQLVAYPHHWLSRGLGGQSFLPADDRASSVYLLDVGSGRAQRVDLPGAVADAAVCADAVTVSCWNGLIYRLTAEHWPSGRPPVGVEAGGPCLLAAASDGSRLIAATSGGVVRALDRQLRELWRADLNQLVPHAEKPWIANAAAQEVVPGLWSLPGGRVDSDACAQYVVQAPHGLILIEAHSGLSFEREWAAIQKAGLDPRQVLYVLLTHEHGDHAPGAYLWRLACGAQVVASDATAYSLQHHVPVGTGYGFSPPVPTDMKITEEADLDLAGLKVRAVQLPGHTPGSMGWALEKSGKRFIATGDLIMSRGVLGFFGSVGASAPDTLASLRKLEAMKADRILGGHCSGTSAEMVDAGIDVGRHVGWGLMPPEAPDPLFRIAQKNVLVTAFACDALAGDFGDLDGDGRPDVVVVSPRDGRAVVRAFLNKGRRFDAMKADWEIPLPGIPLAATTMAKIRLCPLSGGRYPDILVSGGNAAVLVSRGRPGLYDTYTMDSYDVQQLRAVDIEGNGRPQWLAAWRFSGVRPLVPQKDGRLVGGDLEPRLSGPYIDFRELDLNGDGRRDLISSYGDVWLRGLDGRLPRAPTQRLIQAAPNEWCYFAVGDFNGDHRPDVVLVSNRTDGADGCKAARIFYNTGRVDRPFDEKPDTVIKADSGFPYVRDAPTVADFNGDGIDDLVIGMGEDNQVRIYLGGPAGLDNKRVETIPLDYRLHYEHAVYVADFNGDGRMDLAVFGYTNTGIGAHGPNAVYIWIAPAGHPAQPSGNKAKEK